MFSLWKSLIRAATADEPALGFRHFGKICGGAQIAFNMQLDYMTGQKQPWSEGPWVSWEAMGQGGEAELKDITQRHTESSARKHQNMRENIESAFPVSLQFQQTRLLGQEGKDGKN